MEGYFNVSSSHDSFDDLDIEGKTADDFSRIDNKFRNKDNTSLADHEEKRILDLKIELDDGALAYVFSSRITAFGTQWKCHVCDTTLLGPRDLVDHEKSKYHNLVMQASNHHRSQFTRIIYKEDKSVIAPGQPAPPGIEEDAITTTHIQTTLDNYKSAPLIGLEYVIELDDEYEREPAYVCMLCDKKGDPRTVMAHLISYNHRLKYIERHFPITYNAINSLPKTVGAKRGLAEIVLRISSAMEDRFGRLPPVGTDGRHFEQNRFEIVCNINKGKHFLESPDDNFLHLVDRELLTSLPVKTDDIPIPDGAPPPKPIAVAKAEEDDDEVEFQGAFVKGTRVPLNRQLRVRKLSVEPEDKQSGSDGKTPNKGAAENKKDDDVQSLSSISSISTVSSSPRASRPLKRRNSLSRSRSRSRSGSRYRRKRRSRSLSRRRYRRTRSRSRSRRRSRSGSSRRRSRSPHDRSRRRHGRRTESKSRDDDKKHGKEREDDLQVEKAKWEKFREEVSVVEKDLLEKLAFHEKNPEKHPQYPEEWKIFWNRRYKELQATGKDPNKHDFKPEWITFWNKRMREMHDQVFMKKKEDLRAKLGLPLDEVKPHYNRRKRVREAGDAAGGSGPAAGGLKTRSRSPSPWEEGVMSFGNLRERDRERDRDRDRERDRDRDRDREKDRDRDRERERDRDYGHGHYRSSMGMGRAGLGGELRTIAVLRTLTALEQQLGSLGPRVNALLSDAIAREKIRNGNADSLLADNDVVVLFETAKEKLKGQLFAGIVERNMVAATKNAISSIAELLHRAPMLLDLIPPPPQKLHVSPPPAPAIETFALRTEVAPHVPIAPVTPALVTAPAGDPVTVPGVGAVDKAAIAKEIAAALIMQGKTDVSETELEHLINAVVGMAQAQAGLQQPITAAQFVSTLQGTAPSSAPAEAPVPRTTAPEPVLPLNAAVAQQGAQTAQEVEVSALQLLQSAYDGDDNKQGGGNAIGALPQPSALAAAPAPVSASAPVPAAAATPAVIPAAAPTAIPSVAPATPSTAPASKPLSLLTEISDALNNHDAEPVIVRPPLLSKSPAKSTVLVLAHDKRLILDGGYEGDSYSVEDLTETDLRLLLQSFKDLPLDEQHGLIRYLKRLESTDPERVEKLRKYVNLETGGQVKPPPAKALIPQEKLHALAKVGQSGRLSPFSSRQETRNPQPDAAKAQESRVKLDSDSDDDYTFEDVVKAASRTVSEREEVRKAQEREEHQRLFEVQERERMAREKEENERRVLEEKAKAEQALRELEEREREQQRLEKEREKQEREAALKVGVANWNPMNNSNMKSSLAMNSADTIMSSLVSVIPPPLPPPTMASAPNMYSSSYGNMSSMSGYNGDNNYYQSQPNSYSQYIPPPVRDAYNQQNTYYPPPQNNSSSVYQQTAQPPTYQNQNYQGYTSNPMYQQPPPSQQLPYREPPPQQGLYNDRSSQYRW